MKQFRSTAIIFIIFIGFLGYYFWAGKKKTVEEPEKKVYVFNLNKDAIKTLELINMLDGSGFMMKKDKKWMIEKPEEIPASKKTLDGILSELASLSADRDITKDGQRLKQYGLDIPKYKVKFSLGNETHTLLIGIKNPTEEFYFVKEEDRENVYTVKTASVEKFTGRSLNDLRDKELLMVPEEEIRKIDIDIKNKGKLIIVKNKENKWMIQTAGKKDLDIDIRNVIEELKNITIEEFLGKGPKDLKDYGLDKPFYAVKVEKTNDESIDLYLGKIENNLVYINRNKEKSYFKVRRHLVDSIENLYINMKEKQEISEPQTDQKKSNGEKHGH